MVVDTIPNGIRRALNKSKSPLEATQEFVNTTLYFFHIHIQKLKNHFFKIYAWGCYGWVFGGGCYVRDLPALRRIVFGGMGEGKNSKAKVKIQIKKKCCSFSHHQPSTKTFQSFFLRCSNKALLSKIILGCFKKIFQVYIPNQLLTLTHKI